MAQGSADECFEPPLLSSRNFRLGLVTRLDFYSEGVMLWITKGVWGQPGIKWILCLLFNKSLNCSKSQLSMLESQDNHISYVIKLCEN